MSSERLRFSTAILRLLGEELNPSPDQGILELIKNAYDADATECVVELKGAHLQGGSLHVWDNGSGLSAGEIRDGWLVVGNSLKSRRNTSPNGRLLVGSKGLGRLAALRLGHKVTLLTRPKNEPKAQYRVEVDWRRFDRAQVVEDVELAITQEERPSNSSKGTELLIEDLPSLWRETDVSRLARAILLLTDPFLPSQGFRAVLKSPEFEAIASRVNEGYFDECDFHLVATLDDDGHASAKVLDPSGKVLYQAGHAEIVGDKGKHHYHAPAAKFELWEFLLKSKGFSTKSASLTSIRGWLKEFSGVRLYHRGMRMLPYGEPKNDWLDMNLRRVRSPEDRPSTNNSLGYIRVDDPRGILQQKTDRSAFVESEELDELRVFAGDVLDWMSSARLRERDRRRKAERVRIQHQKEAASDKLKQAVAQIPTKFRHSVEEALQKIQMSHEAEVTLLNETAQLYYTLGTVGTTTAAFAHQTKHPLGAIVEDAKALEDWLGNPAGLVFPDLSRKAVQRIKLEAEAIYAFSNITLKLLEHEKRRSRRYSIHELIQKTVGLLDPYIAAREAKVEYDFAPENPHIWCSRAAFESIITNFIINSLQVFTGTVMDRIESEDRPHRILFRTQLRNEKVILMVMDNGHGIDEISVDDVWLPGKTTTTQGTGLGLTIVRDIVLDLNGAVEAIAHGELGGAQFIVTLPIKQ